MGLSEGLDVSDLVEWAVVPPAHGGQVSAARSLQDDEDGSTQHPQPAEPEQQQQHPAGPDPAGGAEHRQLNTPLSTVCAAVCVCTCVRARVCSGLRRAPHPGVPATRSSSSLFSPVNLTSLSSSGIFSFTEPFFSAAASEPADGASSARSPPPVIGCFSCSS